MFSRDIRRHLLVALALVLGISIADPGARCQTITVGLNSSTARSLTTNFYGANAQLRNSVPWDQIDPSTGKPYNPGFANALQGLEYGILRIPTGTGSDFWDWNDGDYVDNYLLPTGVASPPSPYPSLLNEFQNELNSASQPTGTQTLGDFALNVMTDPTCVPPSGQTSCSYSTTSMNESYQLQLLSTLGSDRINVPTVELGNEIYLTGDNYPTVYPTVTDYANMANQWVKDIHASHPSMGVAAVAESCLSCTDTRVTTWNSGLMSTLVGADAVVLHLYTGSGLSSGDPPDNNTAETMLLTPFTKWDNVVANIFPTLVNTSTGYTPPIWFTEYNLNDGTVNAAGTWAHGLYLATYSLLFVTNPRVMMALHHDVQGADTFGDIWSSGNGFSNYGLSITTAYNGDNNTCGTPPCATATYDGYTASGLTTREINTAALGQTSAEALTFPNGPTFDGTHPKLIGEQYSGVAHKQVILLNLDNAAHTVDVSAVVSSGTYRQIYGKAGSYVDGFVLSGGYEGWDDLAGSAANLTLASGTLTPTSLSLPAFSITRIQQ